MQDLDRYLGPYPYDTLKKWVSLTQHITEPLLQRIQPPSKKLSSVCEFPQEHFQTSTKTRQETKVKTDSVVEYHSDDAIRFTAIPKQMYPGGACPAVITKYSLDSSYVLNCMLQQMSG